MKTNTPYPTRHPQGIDELDYLDAVKKRKRIGLSFTTAFILVLSIHLAGVGRVFAFSNLKSDKKTASAPEALVEKQSEPKSDSLARTEWPQPEAEPKVVATPPPFNVDDSAARKAILATRSNSQTVTERQQTFPAAAQVQPVVAPNPETKVETAVAQPPTSIALIKPQSALAPATVQQEQATTSSKPSEYTLALGDNLYMVSRRLQVSYNELMQANGLTDPRQLRVGQKHKVPTHIASL